MGLVIRALNGDVRLDPYVNGDLEPIGALTLSYPDCRLGPIDLDREQMITLRDGLTAIIDRRS